LNKTSPLIHDFTLGMTQLLAELSGLGKR
jgi:hypothetical protein